MTMKKLLLFLPHLETKKGKVKVLLKDKRLFSATQTSQAKKELLTSYLLALTLGKSLLLLE